MVDPHTAAAGTGTLMTVVIFIGSQLSPSIMVRRAVKKELKAAALLVENGSSIDTEGWNRLTELDRRVQTAKLSVEETKWGDVLKEPFKLLFRARRYHEATDDYLFETRSASAQAMKKSARAASQTLAANVTADGDTTASRNEETAPAERPVNPVTPPIQQRTSEETSPTERRGNRCPPAVEQHDSAEIPPGERNVDSDSECPTYHSTKHASESYTTYFHDVEITAGSKARIIMHFGVGDVTVTFNPHEDLPGLPAAYRGPVVLFGYVMLVPCNPSKDSKHLPDVYIGRDNKGYDVEFSGMSWRMPAGFRMSVSKVDDDCASLSSVKAVVGEYRSPDDDDRLSPHYRAGCR